MANNEPISSISHLLGAFLSIAAMVLMVVFAAIHGTASLVVGASIFGSSLILLYLASAWYHAVSELHPHKRILQKLDHAMIFMLIAGTYTPVTLVLPSRPWGWSLFGVIWGLGVFGIIWKLASFKPHTTASTVLYLIMGWVIIIPFWRLTEWFNVSSLLWLSLGGICYTIGSIFYGLNHFETKKRLFGFHEVFHLFVIAGSFCHFWLVLLHL
jgi:hemolysin III